jgi:hypothetical protein
MDITQFRKDFPEFSDVALYPTAMVTFWSAIAEQTTSQPKYGDTYTAVVKLATAHYITLEGLNQKTAANGGTPGQSAGVVSSKSVGDVSVSYDTTIGTITGDDVGQWNATTYGRQYFSLARLFGAGCVQL